jgi:hypothetical protein
MHKYPRTHHLEGSRVQPGDEDLPCIPFALVAGRHLVVEEKLDGANSAVSFTAGGDLLVQSRGHYLTGGPREKQFNLFKAWAGAHQNLLWEVIGSRYVMYGEWVYAKHTIYYDHLPHYFLEFDIYDKRDNVFLSTVQRQALLRGMPVVSVPVVHSGPAESVAQLRALVGRSLYKGPAWQQHLDEVCRARGLDPTRVKAETDPSDEAEGLYIKVETEDRVVERYKLIRPSFLTSVLDSGSHWQTRPIVPNRLRDGVDIFGRG